MNQPGDMDEDLSRILLKGSRASALCLVMFVVAIVLTLLIEHPGGWSNTWKQNAPQAWGVVLFLAPFGWVAWSFRHQPSFWTMGVAAGISAQAMLFALIVGLFFMAAVLYGPAWIALLIGLIYVPYFASQIWLLVSAVRAYRRSREEGSDWRFALGVVSAVVIVSVAGFYRGHVSFS